MVKGEDLEELAHPEYWDQRYASAKKESKEDGASIASFEWFRTFDNLRPFFEKHLPAACSACSILHLGCGNSVSLASTHAPTVFIQLSPYFILAKESLIFQYQPADMHCLIPDVDSRFIRPGIHQPD
jgi:hypothetical protein